MRPRSILPQRFSEDKIGVYFQALKVNRKQESIHGSSVKHPVNFKIKEAQKDGTQNIWVQLKKNESYKDVLQLLFCSVYIVGDLQKNEIASFIKLAKGIVTLLNNLG